MEARKKAHKKHTHDAVGRLGGDLDRGLSACKKEKDAAV
jgi:hypothetical protein